jgi:DNA-binding transcriptional MerR regulator
VTVREPHLPALAPHLSIGEVLEELRGEFPDVTISKIRFLESQGLIDPERTPSGYRKFSDRDLDRLRWILLQQRDHFLPLRVIKDRLDEFGSAGPPTGDSPVRARAARLDTEPLPFEEVIEHADVDAEDDEALDPGLEEALERQDQEPERTEVERAEGELLRSELLEASGLTDAQLSELEDYGLVARIAGAGERAVYGDDALDLAGLAVGFYARGIEARHLKMYKHFSEREAALFAQVLTPYLRQRNPGARARLVEELEELTRLGRRLRAAMLRNALRAELAE